MNLVLFCLLSLLYFTLNAQAKTVNRTLLATTPGNCFSNFECPLNKYCHLASRLLPLNRCLHRITAGKHCDVDYIYRGNTDEDEQTCVSGLTCPNDQVLDKPVCLPQLRRGDLCRVTAPRQCPRDDVCKQAKDGKYRCAAPTFGNLGSRCEDTGECLESKGLYCHNKVCVPKKPAGASCLKGSDCLSGICSTSGKCIALQRHWKMCLSSSDCENSGNAFRNGDHAYCNVEANSGELGRCIRDSKLLKTLGAPCSRKFDRCDHRRGLSCGWGVSERRFRCQQMTIGGYCSPSSKYSRCKSDIWPRDCFLAQYWGENWDFKPRFNACNPKRILVSIGTACNRAQVEGKCPKGASCLFIPGVLQYYSGYTPSSLMACVYPRGLGQQCGNKFRTKCKPGLKCEGGKCVKGTIPCCPPHTHADIGYSCKKLPCIPGAKCVDGRCWKPNKVMKLGQPCYESVFHNATCEKPLRCLGNFRGEGVWLCRKPRPAGGSCKSDADCRSKLKCTPREWYKTQKCFDKQKVMKVGKHCNPKAKWNEKRCVGNKLLCLPKNSGHVCQHAATLFEYCSPKNNTICLDSRLKCDSATSACTSK